MTAYQRSSVDGKYGTFHSLAKYSVLIPYLCIQPFSECSRDWRKVFTAMCSNYMTCWDMNWRSLGKLKHSLCRHMIYVIHLQSPIWIIKEIGSRCRNFFIIGLHWSKLNGWGNIYLNLSYFSYIKSSFKVKIIFISFVFVNTVGMRKYFKKDYSKIPLKLTISQTLHFTWTHCDG